MDRAVKHLVRIRESSWNSTHKFQLDHLGLPGVSFGSILCQHLSHSKMAACKVWMMVVILYVVRTGCEQETTYLLENPGHSEELAACSGNMQDTHCWRVDAPQPTEECVERDPVSQMCLRVVSLKKAAVIPQRVTGHASVEKSPTEDPISCDGTDPLCVPDGIHLDMGGNCPLCILDGLLLRRASKSMLLCAEHTLVELIMDDMRSFPSPCCMQSSASPRHHFDHEILSSSTVCS